MTVGGWLSPAYPPQPPFSPSQLPSLELWLRGDVGLTPSSWTDQSGSGNTATQASGGLQPSSGTLDGQAAAVFSGSQAMGMPLDFTSGVKTVYVVCGMSATPGGGSFYSALSLNTNAAITELIMSNIGGGYTPITFVGDLTGLTTVVGFSPTLDTSKHIIGFTWNGSANNNASNYTATYDGVTQSVATSSNVSRSMTDLSSIGGRLSSGNVLTDGFVGSIAEVIVTGNVMSAANATLLQAYLAARYP